MAGEVDIKFGGAEDLKKALEELAPEMRRGPGRRALVKGAEPVLAKAIAEAPELSRDVYKRGKMIRRKGTLKRALKIRSSKDVNKTGDVGVFVNIKPLNKGAIVDFKAATGRRAADNPDDPFYWRFREFATRRNKNPERFLRKAGAILQGTALPLITGYLKAYFDRINKKRK